MHLWEISVGEGERGEKMGKEEGCSLGLHSYIISGSIPNSAGFNGEVVFCVFILFYFMFFPRGKVRIRG